MLEFTDQPYKFFPPRPSRPLIRLARWANHTFILPGPNHRIADIQIEGEAAIRKQIGTGARLLFLPNHSTHSDPQVMFEVCHRLGTPTAFMAAYDVFLRSKLSAWCMQHLGSFSVDREGSDRRAMSTAIAVLKETGALTIFPEGNVYFTADRVTPFLEGAAFIGIKAQRDLGDSAAVYAVPVAMKITHLRDQRRAALDRLDEAAALVGTHCDRSADPLGELQRIGQLALERHLRARGFEVPDGNLSLSAKLEAAAAAIIGSLESDIGQQAREGDDLTERLRKIRSKIHQVRIASDSTVDTATAAGWADRAILALRMLGYTGNYVADHPTLDRFAETTDKLIEDLQSKAPRPYGKRRAIVHFCEPIDLREFPDRAAASRLTDLVESTVQGALDAINRANRSAGSRAFVE